VTSQKHETGLRPQAGFLLGRFLMSYLPPDCHPVGFHSLTSAHPS
jgi:hypothetical protein